MTDPQEKKDGCYLEIANKTLSCPDVVKLFQTVEKGIVNSVTDDIISQRYKEIIRSQVVNADAGAMIREVSSTLNFFINF